MILDLNSFCATTDGPEPKVLEMPSSKLPTSFQEFLHFSGLKKLRGADAMLVDGAYLRHYFDAEPGQRIYHYTSARGAEGILESGNIWISEYTRTNDASEFTFAQARFSDEIDKLRGRFRASIIALYERELAAFLQRKSMLIGCFTESRDDLSQWDRYADRAAGCVIGLNAYWYVKHKGVQFRRVIYDAEYLAHLVEANLKIIEWADTHLDAEDEFTRGMLATLFVFEQFCFKDPRFSSEAEVRMLRAVQANPEFAYGFEDMSAIRTLGMKGTRPLAVPLEIKQRQGPYGSTRYLEIPCAYKTWPAIRSVGFGPKCSSADEERIRNRFRHLRDVEFWRSDLPIR